MDLSGLEASLVHLVSSRAVGQPESGLLVKLHASILRKIYGIKLCLCHLLIQFHIHDCFLFNYYCCIYLLCVGYMSFIIYIRVCICIYIVSRKHTSNLLMAFSLILINMISVLTTWFYLSN